MKYAGISFVASKKLILNVSKIRLRLIFSRASDIPRLFQKAYGKWYFRTATEGGGSTQKRRFCAAKTRVQKCTRMYTSGQAIFKRLTERVQLLRAAHKLILNVAGAARMAVVPCRSDVFAGQKLVAQAGTRMYRLEQLCFFIVCSSIGIYNYL